MYTVKNVGGNARPSGDLIPTLLAFFNEQILESGAKVMKQWDRRWCGDSGEATDVKCGPSCKLPLLKQLLLNYTLALLLACRCGLSQSLISQHG